MLELHYRLINAKVPPFCLMNKHGEQASLLFAASLLQGLRNFIEK
jgi:hypothetical protein